MLSIAKRPSESEIAVRAVPSTESRAPTNGSRCRLSTATPSSQAVVAGAAGVAAAGDLVVSRRAVSLLAAGRAAGRWAAAGTASRSAPRSGAASRGRRMRGI